MNLDDFAPTDDGTPKGWEAGVEVGLEDGTITTGPLTEPVKDWTDFLTIWNLDAEEFEVVEPATFKAWDVAAKETNADGTQRLVSKRLYSYKAQIVRRKLRIFSEIDLTALRAEWRTRKVASPRKGKISDEPECSFVVNWADWQLYKSEGGGVQTAIDRIQKSLDGTVRRLEELRKIGRNITEIVIANNGDPIEGCDGNYQSQLFTVTGTLREQLLLAHDLWAEGVYRLAPLAPSVKFVSVLSNHSEWTRRGPGTKPITSDSDNADGFLADMLRRTLDGRAEFGHIDWHIPHDEMTVVVDVAGVPVAFNHGHKVTGKGQSPAAKFMDWAKNQVFHNRDYKDVRLWITAHLHHLALSDFGDSFWVQCPSQDGGSKWLKDSRGTHSADGCLTLLVGQHDKRGWSDLQVV